MPENRGIHTTNVTYRYAFYPTPQSFFPNLRRAPAPVFLHALAPALGKAGVGKGGTAAYES